MELLFSAKLAHSKFHGIPWNCLCQRNLCTSSSMEFHGTSRVRVIGAFLYTLNSMELLVSAILAHFKFHGISWNSMEQLVSSKLGTPRNSVELLMSAKLVVSLFHGIPWPRNWRTQSSMEFHGTALVSEIGTPQVPWNSMELLVSTKLAHFKFHGIP